MSNVSPNRTVIQAYSDPGFALRYHQRPCNIGGVSTFARNFAGKVKGAYKQSARVLDAGCGDARDTLFFLKQGISAVGIDASPALIDIAAETAKASGFKRWSLRCKDLLAPDLIPGEFNGIYCNEVLHFFTRDEAKEVLGQFKRACYPKGVIAIRLYRGGHEGTMNDSGFQVYFQSYSHSDLQELLKSIKFDSFEIRPVLHDMFPPTFASPQPWWKVWIRR